MERFSEQVGMLIDVARVVGDTPTVETEEVRLNDLLKCIVNDCTAEAAGNVGRNAIRCSPAGPQWKSICTGSAEASR